MHHNQGIMVDSKDCTRGYKHTIKQSKLQVLTIKFETIKPLKSFMLDFMIFQIRVVH